MSDRVLRVHLFGTFQLSYGDNPLQSVNTTRLQSLLAYLILHADSPQARHHIAFLLWTDTHESHARNNLRQFLHQLRRALPEPERFLVADANAVYWKTDEHQHIDLHLFERARREAELMEQRGDARNLRAALERMVSYYAGDFLPACYDEWITPQRERLRKDCHHAHQKLARLFETQREYAHALQVAQHLLHFDPLDESTYVTLMRLHTLNDDHSGARRVYQTAVETLQRELGVEPSETLRNAFER